MSEKSKELEAPVFNIRTDLAIETREMIRKEQDVEIPGVKVNIEEDREKQIKVSWVEVLDAEGEKQMGKPVGNYVTIESPMMKENDIDAHEEIIKILAKQLVKILNLDDDAFILVVGLGNWNITPDALGPKVVSKIFVTRHLLDHIPEQVDESVRPVSAIAPGVMGLTGIETSEIIEGVVKKIKPDLVIAIDALASRKTSRVNTTIQIADTGVHPGSGVGNSRRGLNEETLGVPVIALGVPTVVDAATLVNDTMDHLIDAMLKEANPDKEFYKMLKNLNEQEKYQLIREVLNPYVGNLFVTPKEIDSVIDRLANIIANAINIALHPGIDLKDINRFTY
ncbi:MAG: GPR endopeptidase [Epulopiscium sp.]|jgi:spore protease|nr:GPR endopeptidase [Candidatus Epulonipiscium sp.]HOQ17697.1 GPR endopeptidase [Defluviitaleaceae bacterium]HPT75377.1 GPR endopeptidase [Defluviitaleaceae bacterium]